MQTYMDVSHELSKKNFNHQSLIYDQEVITTMGACEVLNLVLKIFASFSNLTEGHTLLHVYYN